jgi:predicted RNase H-like HicB family nuclease
MQINDLGVRTGIVVSEAAMPGTNYYSLFERDADGCVMAWVPDLPGVTAYGVTEDEVLHELSRRARECLRTLILDGKPIPSARPVDQLPRRQGQREFRRLLLIIG